MRMRKRTGRMGRAGFTLVEVLVTLVLIALLIGVVLPSVINQMDRGEPTRMSQDIESLRTAVKMFRIDVKRWPATIDQLVREPGTPWSTLEDYDGNEIPEALRDRWAGPYLEVGTLTDTPGLRLALGAEVDNTFGTTTWGGSTFLDATVTDVTQDLAEKISELVDGNTTVTTTGDTGGRIRYDANADEMFVLLAPIN